MTNAANEYAEALYGLADEEGLQEDIYPQVTQVEDILRNNLPFLDILGAPNIPREERCAALDSCFKGAVHPYLLNTLKLMCEKGHARDILPCLKAYGKIYLSRHGIISVTAVSAVPMTEDQIARLTAKLEKMTGKQIRLKNIVRPECLGGVRLDFDGRQIDDTVRHRLDEVRGMLCAAEG